MHRRLLYDARLQPRIAKMVDLPVRAACGLKIKQERRCDQPICTSSPLSRSNLYLLRIRLIICTRVQAVALSRLL